MKAKCDKKSTCKITPTADYFDSTQDFGWAEHAPSGSDWKVPKLYIIYSCNGGTDMTTVHKTKPTRAPTRAPTWAPTWAPPRPVCSTQPGSRGKKLLGYNQGWIDFSCMSGGSDRRHRLKRQVIPMACLTIKAVVTGCGRGYPGSFYGERTWRLNKVTLNMNGVWVKISSSILSPLLLGTDDTYFQAKAQCDKKSTCRITPTAEYFDSLTDCKVPKMRVVYTCNGGTDMTTVHQTKGRMRGG